jgi:hypothetical protein
MLDQTLMIDLARYAHIVAVAIGFGTAFLADYHLLSRLRRPVDDSFLDSLDLYHSVVWKMLLAMWITGVILIGIRTGFVLSNFSPKLISKLVTVSVLTANAALIGHFAMPVIRAARGRSILWLPRQTKLGLAIIGAISSASWLLALAMGSSKVLAASSSSVFLVLLPLVYTTAVVLALATIGVGSKLVKARVCWPKSGPAPANEVKSRAPVPSPIPAE